MSRSQPPRPQDVLQDYMDDLLTSSDEPLQTAYADSLEEQRERLQRLLYSGVTLAQPETESARVEPVVVEPTIETESAQQAFARAEREAEAELAREAQGAQEAQVVRQAQVEQEAEQARLAAEEAARLESLQVELDTEPEPEALDSVIKDVEWLDNGRPAWAQQRFDVLLFKVSGLTLAVPLIALGQIQPLTDELTPLFGQADWFMGLLPTPGGKIRTVNTAKFVMPERYDEAFLRTAQYVISINGVPWGLAVDSVNQPISLNPDDVKWRTERSRRPWLAGTVKEHMCALLDIPRIGQLLMAADTRRATPYQL